MGKTIDKTSFSVFTHMPGDAVLNCSLVRFLSFLETPIRRLLIVIFRGKTFPAVPFFFLFLLLGSTGCALFFPSKGRSVDDFSLVTPERAFESFKKAFEAENPSLEWRCLSDKLKEREGLTEAKYTIGRSQFISNHKEAIENFKKAEIREFFYAPDRMKAKLVVAAPDTLATLELINQPYYEIIMSRNGEEELVWGFLKDLEERITLVEERGKEYVKIRIPLDEAIDESEYGLDTERIVSFTLADEWKLLNLEVFSNALSDLE